MKTRAVILLLVLCSLVSLLATPSFSAEQGLDDLLKKSESAASPLLPTLSIPQISPTAPLIPRTEQPKIPAAEKARLTTDEPAPIIIKELPTSKEPAKLSALEELITTDDTVEADSISDDNPARSLTQFGYSYFKNTSFAPQGDVPVSADYLVGPGDNLVLSVWGSIEGTYDLTVSRNGEVILPKIGLVKVAGLPYGKLPEIFRLRLAKIFRDFDLAVNIGKLRSSKIYVVGEVNAPGDYTVSSLATIINALSAAGGPTKNGSLRAIRLRRATGGEELIDLYDFFTTGDKSRDVRLHSGDTIFVPVIGKVAAIAGNVKRPAIYELNGQTTLKKLLALAEGVTATGYLQRVQISRVTANEKKNVLDINLDPTTTGKKLDELTEAINLQDLDIVRVFSINNLLRNHFRVEGHVERPGFYALQPGTKVSSVLTHDNLLPEYAPAILELTRLCPPDLHPEKQVLDLTKALANDPLNDLALREFDIIRVYSRWELEELPIVKISGEVIKPGEYRLYDNMTIRDLILQGGGFKPAAYRQRADLVHLQRGREKVQQEIVTVNLEEALKGNSQHNLHLQHYDELLIRRIPEWAEEKDRYATLVGEVVFPGNYPIARGERLSSVIERAGGFTDKAFFKGIKFTREPVRQLQQKRMDEQLIKVQEQILKLQISISQTATSKEEIDAAKATLEGLQRSLDLVKGKKAEGRMIVSFTSLADLKQGSSDLELQGGDTLTIPKDPGGVNVLGSVFNQTSIVYQPDKSVEYYLDMVGGVTKDADLSQLYVVKSNGTVLSRQNSSSFLFFNSFNWRSIDSGDTIIIPQQLEKTAWLRDFKDITTILSQAAITAGTVLLGLR